VCLLGLSLGQATIVPVSVQAEDQALAFPGAVGWAKHTAGGRGGKIIKVSNLKAEGEGSLRAALEAEGPRIVVFEVGGIIDLGAKTITVKHPFLTIAGQTAPSPGITIIQGGLVVKTHDVVIQHLRIRSGESGQPKRSGFDLDNISTQAGAYNVIVDHCSLTWATDENLSASGPRFTGETPEEWRKGTSHNITFSQNIIGEGLANATHAKGEHSKGSLIHDNVSNILLYGNLYAHNYERNPHFKGGVHGTMVNNLIYNPGQRAVLYNLQAQEWAGVPFQNGKVTAVGNVMRAGPSTPSPIAFLMIGGDGDLEYYGKDNIVVDRIGNPLPKLGRFTTGRAEIIQKDAPLNWPDGLEAKDARDVETWIFMNVGARPWDRDKHDVRLLSDTAEGRGKIIDSQDEVGGYPDYPATYRAFDPSLWNLFDMTPKSPEALDGAAKAKGT
jgi:pectate lyase